MSRSIRFVRAGGPDALGFVEAADPEPDSHAVRIRVATIGINRAESMRRSDAYIEPVRFTPGLGYEAAGIVDTFTHLRPEIRPLRSPRRHQPASTTHR